MAMVDMVTMAVKAAMEAVAMLFLQKVGMVEMVEMRITGLLVLHDLQEREHGRQMAVLALKGNRIQVIKIIQPIIIKK